MALLTHGRRFRSATIALLVALLVVACANLVPRQGWSRAAGPVVPHDSFPADCSLCHIGSDWHTLRPDFAFDHGKRTGVELHGAHSAAACLLCHNDRGPVQQFTARGCGGCHADPHGGRLGANCRDCHDETTWLPKEAIAQHDRTRFPLVGMHAATACFRCHGGAQVGNFAGAFVECGQCHADDYARTAAPNHALVGFSQDCGSCHLPIGWQSARFDHPASFPLTFGHAGRRCGDCHATSNSFTGQSSDCASCHTDDYTATTEPNHGAAGFATGCVACHDTRTWRSADWQHPGAFALTFGHAGRRCSECHVGQQYSGTSSDCASCHLDTYQATTNPNHGTAGFGTDCAGCHGTATWTGGAVAHPASFPLTNAHQRSCTSCHTGGVYTGLDPACVSCHLADWQQANDPPHQAFQLGQQCEQCHGTTTWGSGNWQHDFPLQGEHNLACFDCHDNAANRLLFECIHCHEHRQSEANSEHQGVNGYVWASANCYQCHPNGDD
ncbi:MAG: hypothetical protein JNK15_20640 [Planctomycetes bacterium]|nr:hypothetical protein [Planctomycetota bacterium]